MAIISPDLQNEIIALAELLAVRFSQPEFIPGCEVIDVTDLSEYATNNGWIEAVCGQHNQQRVRWKSGETVEAGDFVDVLYFADRRLFEAWGLGGSTGIPTPGGWKMSNTLVVGPAGDYANVTDAISAASAGDRILIDLESSSETITVNKAVYLVGLARGGTVFTNSITITAAARLYNIKVTHDSVANAKGFICNQTDVAVLYNCEAVTNGSTTSRAIEQTAAGSTQVYGGYYESGGAGTSFEVFVSSGSVILYNQPVLFTGAISGNAAGQYTTSGGDLFFVNGTGMSGGVWLYKTGGTRDYYTSLTLAAAAAGAGDIIHLFPGTYTLTSQLAFGAAFTIEGEGPETIINCATNSISLLLLNSAGAALRNLKITHSGAGVLNSGVYITANATVENVTVTLSGSATANYAVLQQGGTATLTNVIATASGATTNHAYRNDTGDATVTINGGRFSGTQADIYSERTATVGKLNEPVLANASHAWQGTLNGIGLDGLGRRLRLKPAGINGGRLTLTSGTPVSFGETGATTIYYTPYQKSEVEVFNGYFWIEIPFVEISVAVPGTVYKLFDIFAYDNAGTLTLETVDWNQSTGTVTAASNAAPIVITSNGHGLSNNDTVAVVNVGGNTAANGIWSVANVAANTFELEGSTGNGAFSSNGTWYKLNTTRATAITLQDGRYCKNGALTRLYIGTGMTTGTSGQIEQVAGNAANMLLWNYYNQVEFRCGIVDTTSHTYTTATLRIYRNINTNKLAFVTGVVENHMNISLMAEWNFDSGDGSVQTAAGHNRTGAASLILRISDVGQFRYAAQVTNLTPTTGYQFVQLIQLGAATSPDFLVGDARYMHKC